MGTRFFNKTPDVGRPEFWRAQILRKNNAFHVKNMVVREMGGENDVFCVIFA
jgi:hypothetical protein